MHSNHLYPEPDLTASFDDRTDQAIAALKAKIDKDPTVLDNFLRYGYAIGTGKKRAFYSLNAGSRGAVVETAPTYGTAARAGLERGTVITSIDGKPTAGLTQDALDQLVAPLDAYEMVVQNADGTHATIKFAAQDIRWYLSHPLSQ